MDDEAGKVSRIIGELEESIRRQQLALFCHWDVPGQHGRGYAPLTKAKTENGEAWKLSTSLEKQLQELEIVLSEDDRHDLISFHRDLDNFYDPAELAPEALVIIKPEIVLVKRPNYKRSTKVAMMNLAATIAHAQLQDFNEIFTTLQHMDAKALTKLLNDYNRHAAIMIPNHQRVLSRNCGSHSEDLIQMLKVCKSTAERDLIVVAILRRQEMFTKLGNLEVNVAANHFLDTQEKETEQKKLKSGSK